MCVVRQSRGEEVGVDGGQEVSYRVSPHGGVREERTGCSDGAAGIPPSSPRRAVHTGTDSSSNLQPRPTPITSDDFNSTANQNAMLLC